MQKNQEMIAPQSSYWRDTSIKLLERSSNPSVVECFTSVSPWELKFSDEINGGQENVDKYHV